VKKVLVVELNDDPEYQRLLDGQPQTCGMRAGKVYLKPGQACGQHSTAEHEETLIFLSGQGELLIGKEERFVVGQGKISYIPPNTVHDVKNTGTKPLVYIYCVAPTAKDEGRCLAAGGQNPQDPKNPPILAEFQGKLGGIEKFGKIKNFLKKCLQNSSQHI